MVTLADFPPELMTPEGILRPIPWFEDVIGTTNHTRTEWDWRGN